MLKDLSKSRELVKLITEKTAQVGFALFLFNSE